MRDDSPLDPLWVSHCINEIKGDDSIVVNEYDLVPTQVDFQQPGTIFGNSPAAGSRLGSWGVYGGQARCPRQAGHRDAAAMAATCSATLRRATLCHRPMSCRR